MYDIDQVKAAEEWQMLAVRTEKEKFRCLIGLQIKNSLTYKRGSEELKT